MSQSYHNAPIRKISWFKQVEIETITDCNRFCASCSRQSSDHPEMAAWFSSTILDTDIVNRIIEETATFPNMHLNLSHLNECLMDSRLETFAEYAKSLGICPISICSNGDFMTDKRAATLDGLFDYMNIALYMTPEEQLVRESTLRSRFKKTELRFTGGEHIVTHNSPLTIKNDVKELVNMNQTMPCYETERRMIINHKGNMALCTEDNPTHFGLGNIRNNTLEELWFSEKHQEIMLRLRDAGGRLDYPFCAECPRPSGAYGVGTNGQRMVVVTVPKSERKRS